MSETQKIYEETLKYYEKMLKSKKAVDREEIKKVIAGCRIEIKKCIYRECNHLWVTLPSEDEYEERLLGCVKCGFTNSFFPKVEKVYNKLNEEEKASFEHMIFSLDDTKSMHSESWCDLELGRAIYKKLIEAHPNATDKEISDYLSYALWKMRTRDQSEERKASRVRRLGLRRNFNAWNPEFEQE